MLDTSVFVAREQGRTAEELPPDAYISVVTLAELHVGILNAEDPTSARSGSKR
jgi:predicted nucleic acid-binding protein